MIKFRDIKNLPDAKKLAKLAAAAAAVWLIGILLLSNALVAIDACKTDIRLTDSVLSGAAAVKARPGKISKRGDPLRTVSDMAETLKLKDRVGQLSSGASGLVLRIEKLYPDELSDVIDEMRERGLSVKTAELRAMPAGKAVRLINAVFVLTGEEK